MKVILKKLITDFRYSKVKVLLLILASSLSGWGISSVVYSFFMTERDFEENFEVTYPADMTIDIDNYSPNMKGLFLEDKEVMDLERREAIRARIRANDGSWIPIIIYAIEDLNNMRYDRIRVLTDENEVSNKILIEKNALFYLKEDKQEIDLLFQGSEKIVTWELGGRAHDARQAPARMEGMIYAYTTPTQKLEPLLKEGRRRLLIKTNVSSDINMLQEVSERLSKICTDNGGIVVSSYIPTPGKHIHQDLVDSIAFLQRSGGSILSLMGIILLSLILLTWILPQIADIGVMKAIGASTRHIFTSYTLVLAGIILMGIIIGLPIGYKTASMYSGTVAFFQNFEEVTTLLPIPVHALVVFICMAVPLLFGIYPLLKSSNTSVNEAFNKTFYIPKRGFFRLSQQIISSVKMKYSLNNLLRHSQRTALIILLLAIGMALFFTATNVDISIRKDLAEYAKTSQYEIVVALPEHMTKEEVSFLDELTSVNQVSGLNTYMVTHVPPMLGNPEWAVVKTLSPDFDIDRSLVRRGEIDKSCTECIYIGSEELSQYFAHVELGTSIELTTDEGEIQYFKFSGVVEDMMVIGAPFIRYDQNVSTHFNGLAFKLNPNLSTSENQIISNEIDDLFIENGINIRSLQSVQRRLFGIIGHLEPTFLIIRITGIFTIVLGLLGLVIVLNLTIQERSREIGIMKSIGSPFVKISAMFKQEFLSINVIAIFIGGLIAIPVSTALIAVIAETIIKHPVAFNFDWRTNLISIAVVLTIQTILITIYNRNKINNNARELMDHNF